MGRMDWELLGLATLLAVAIVLVVGALIAGVRFLYAAGYLADWSALWGVQWRPERRSDRPLHAFPVHPLDEMPGRFKIWGVMRGTEEELEWVIDAKLQANAVAKAELRGMVVTKVERLSSVDFGRPLPAEAVRDDEAHGVVALDAREV